MPDIPNHTIEELENMSGEELDDLLRSLREQIAAMTEDGRKLEAELQTKRTELEWLAAAWARSAQQEIARQAQADRLSEDPEETDGPYPLSQEGEDAADDPDHEDGGE